MTEAKIEMVFDSSMIIEFGTDESEVQKNERVKTTVDKALIDSLMNSEIEMREEQIKIEQPQASRIVSDEVVSPA